MKKLSFASIFVMAFLIISTQAFSQMKIGVRAGGNYSTFQYGGEALEVKDGLIGPHAGIVVYSSLSSPVYLQSGLLYSVKGVSAADEDMPDLEMSLKYEFIELPVNVGFQIPIGSNFKISPYIGAYGAYAYKGTAKFMGMSIDIFDNDFIDEDDDKAKRIDYGANVGLGFHFGSRIILNAQYSHGLANLGDADDTVNSRTASLGLTFVF